MCGRQAITINSGTLVEFGYTGNFCNLVFDVAQFTQYPGILVQVDEGPVVKTQLSAGVRTVPIAPGQADLHAFLLVITWKDEING
ncbi:MAG: hypothetical protein WC975_16775 [Phycisphaerae bacterium]